MKQTTGFGGLGAANSFRLASPERLFAIGNEP
jgi:hypothetical protein